MYMLQHYNIMYIDMERWRRQYINIICNMIFVPMSDVYIGEHGGVVVEHRTMNREVLGLIPIGRTVLCT